MKNFRTYQMAKELFQAGQKLKLKGAIKDQFERASLSVVLNLAEGSAKTGADRKRFFTIALGSLRETQACLDILDSPLKSMADKVASSLYRLIKNPGPGV